MTLINRICLYIYRSMNKLFFKLAKIYYSIFLKFFSVNYTNTPKIIGKLILSNKGSINLGDNITFCSKHRANLAGIYKPCSIAVLKGATLLIKENTGLSGCSIFCSKNIEIGKNCIIGANTHIWDTDFHPLNKDDRKTGNNEKIKKESIRIGNDVFIGANCIILKGVTIGDNSIIGAGSVIRQSIPENQIWAGNPAVFIKIIK